jgi:hypothetical protein
MTTTKDKLLHPELKTKAQRRRAIAVAELAEKSIASKDFLYFLNFVYILQPPQLHVGIVGGRTKFEKWPHLMGMAKDFILHRLIDLIKARQLGWSWLVAAYSTWVMMFHDGAVVLLLSKGEKESYALLRKAKFVYRNLPESWQVPLDADSGSEFSLQGMSGTMTALPSTEDAGRGPTATLVVQDEADHHTYLDTNYLAVKPTIDAGGQLIMGSTVNKRKRRSLFTNLWRAAPGNGWHKVFWGWGDRSDRDEKWHERTRMEAADLPDAQEMGVDLYMEQEYPGTAEEALKPSRVRAAFDVDVLEAMKAETRDPIETRGTMNFYQKYVVGRRYAAGTDPSHGVGGDYGVTVIVDVATGAGVADIRENNISSEQLAFDSVKLLQEYDNPIWAIEDNDWGVLVIRKAQDLEYPNLYERKKDIAGWHTSDSNRPLLWGELMEAVNTQTVTIFSKLGLAQFASMIRNPDKNGRIEGEKGTHDDYPMAFGIAWQMRDHAFDPTPTKVYKVGRDGEVMRERVNV